VFSCLAAPLREHPSVAQGKDHVYRQWQSG
jgi:hypothetical protein